MPIRLKQPAVDVRIIVPFHASRPSATTKRADDVSPESQSYYTNRALLSQSHVVPNSVLDLSNRLCTRMHLYMLAFIRKRLESVNLSFQVQFHHE